MTDAELSNPRGDWYHDPPADIPSTPGVLAGVSGVEDGTQVSDAAVETRRDTHHETLNAQRESRGSKQ